MPRDVFRAARHEGDHPMVRLAWMQDAHRARRPALPLPLPSAFMAPSIFSCRVSSATGTVTGWPMRPAAQQAAGMITRAAVGSTSARKRRVGLQTLSCSRAAAFSATSLVVASRAPVLMFRVACSSKGGAWPREAPQTQIAFETLRRLERLMPTKRRCSPCVMCTSEGPLRPLMD